MTAMGIDDQMVVHLSSRRFGWDTHGLPVEFEIDQQLGIKDREQVRRCYGFSIESTT